MNTATPRKLDLDNIADYSAATRELQVNAPGLDDALNAIRDDVTVKAAALSKQALADATDCKITLAKDALVAAYVKREVEASWSHQHQQALEAEARKDMFLARSLNNAVDDARAAAADITSGFNSSDPSDVIHTLTWRTDEALTAQWKAHYALQVIRRIGEGKNIREAAAEVAKGAMFVVMGFPSHIKANGTGSAYRLEDTTKACAAVWFVQHVASYALGDTVPVRWLTH